MRGLFGGAGETPAKATKRPAAGEKLRANRAECSMGHHEWDRATRACKRNACTARLDEAGQSGLFGFAPEIDADVRRREAKTGQSEMFRGDAAKKNPGRGKKKARKRNDEDLDYLQEMRQGGSVGTSSVAALEEGSSVRGVAKEWLAKLATSPRFGDGSGFTVGELASEFGRNRAARRQRRNWKGQKKAASSRDDGGESVARHVLEKLANRGIPLVQELGTSYRLDAHGRKSPAKLWGLTEYGREMALADRLKAAQGADAVDASVEAEIARYQGEAPAAEALPDWVTEGAAPARPKRSRKPKAEVKPRTRTYVEPHAEARPPCRLCKVEHSLGSHRSHKHDAPRRRYTLAGALVGGDEAARRNPMSKRKGLTPAEAETLERVFAAGGNVGVCQGRLSGRGRKGFIQKVQAIRMIKAGLLEGNWRAWEAGPSHPQASGKGGIFGTAKGARALKAFRDAKASRSNPKAKGKAKAKAKAAKGKAKGRKASSRTSTTVKTVTTSTTWTHKAPKLALPRRMNPRESVETRELIAATRGNVAALERLLVRSIEKRDRKLSGTVDAVAFVLSRKKGADVARLREIGTRSWENRNGTKRRAGSERVRLGIDSNAKSSNPGKRKALTEAQKKGLARIAAEARFVAALKSTPEGEKKKLRALAAKCEKKSGGVRPNPLDRDEMRMILGRMRLEARDSRRLVKTGGTAMPGAWRTLGELEALSEILNRLRPPTQAGERAARAGRRIGRAAYRRTSAEQDRQRAEKEGQFARAEREMRERIAKENAKPKRSRKAKGSNPIISVLTGIGNPRGARKGNPLYHFRHACGCMGQTTIPVNKHTESILEKKRSEACGYHRGQGWKAKNPRKGSRSSSAGQVGKLIRWRDLTAAEKKDPIRLKAARIAAELAGVRLEDLVGEVCRAQDGTSAHVAVVGELESLNYKAQKKSGRAFTADGRRITWDHTAGSHGKGRKKTKPQLVCADPKSDQAILVSRRGSRAGVSRRRGLIG